jgi:predicted metal-binding membrane protein
MQTTDGNRIRYGDHAIFTQKSTLVGGLLVAAAWALLVMWSRSPYGSHMDHETLGHGGPSLLVRLAIFLVGWTLMVAAMMLPLELGSLRRIAQAHTHRSGAAGSLIGYVLAYTVVWAIFGALLYAGDGLLHEVVEHNHLLEEVSWAFAGVILVITGLYQITSWKQDCLRGGHGVALTAEPGGWRLGWQHGIACLGSCWGLMLAMFAVGRMNLAVMLAVTVLMVAERSERTSRWAVPLIGLLFVALGLAGLVQAGP